jgi:hypothetical protein
MPSSERKHYLRFAHSRFAANEPFHAHARDLIGDVNHLADQFSQRRVAWVAREAAHYFEPEGGASIAANTFYLLWRSLPFDIHVRENGESYALRTRLRGAISAGTGTASFRVVVAAEGHGRAYYGSLSNPNVSHRVTSSTAHAWIETASSVVHLDNAMVIQATRDAPSTDEIHGVPSVTTWLRATAEVWAATSSAASVPRLSGLQVDEFYDAR